MTEFSYNVGDVVRQTCQTCKNINAHQIRAVFNGLEDADCIVESWQVVECCGCNTVSFSRRSGQTHTIDSDGAMIEYTNRFKEVSSGLDLASAVGGFFLGTVFGKLAEKDQFKFSGTKNSWCDSCHTQTEHQIVDFGKHGTIQSRQFGGFLCSRCGAPTMWMHESGIFYTIPPRRLDIPLNLQGKHSGELYLAAMTVKETSITAAIALLRLAVEAWLEDFAVALGEKPKLGLDARIGWLAAKEYISKQTKDELDILRIYGNDAVHSLRQIEAADTPATLNKLVKLFENVLNDVARGHESAAMLAIAPLNKVKGRDNRDKDIKEKHAGGK